MTLISTVAQHDCHHLDMTEMTDETDVTEVTDMTDIHLHVNVAYTLFMFVVTCDVSLSSVISVVSSAY